MVDYSTFCTRPWNELHIEEDGRITPCCVMPSSLGFYPPKGIKNYLNSTELKKLNMPSETPMIFKKNTLIIVDTSGFHRRGEAAENTVRLALRAVLPRKNIYSCEGV